MTNFEKPPIQVTTQVIDQIMTMATEKKIPKKVRDDAMTLVSILRNAPGRFFKASDKGEFNASRYFNGDFEHDLALAQVGEIQKAMGKKVDVAGVLGLIWEAIKPVCSIVKFFTTKG